jgi:hypothetical protein
MQIVYCYFITLFVLHVSDVIHIHPQERHIMYMQMIQVSARVIWRAPRRVWLFQLGSWKPDTAWNGSTHTCTYLYHLHVHYMTLLRMDVYYIRNMWSKKCNKITLNNLHQAGPNKSMSGSKFRENRVSGSHDFLDVYMKFYSQFVHVMTDFYEIRYMISVSFVEIGI